MKIKPSWFLIPVLFVIIVQVLSFFSVYQNAERKLEDFFFTLRGDLPISGDVVLVTVDDESFRSLDTTWPFPRRYYAKLIENLNKAGARQIIFDIEFTEESNPLDDSLLAEAAAKYGNVVFAGKIVREVGRYEKTQLIPPIRAIRNRNIPWGIVNIYSDQDGFIRSYNLFELYNKKPIYSIGTYALANLKSFPKDWQHTAVINNNSISFGKTSIPLQSGSRTLINYCGKDGTFPRYSFATVLDDESFLLPGFEDPDFQLNEFNNLLAKKVFLNKVVLVGASVDELHDKFNTPFNTERVLMPGVEIHANFVEMAKRNAFLKRLCYGYFLLLCFFIAFLTNWLNRIIKPVIAFLLNIVLIGLYIATDFYFFSHHNLLIPILQLPIMMGGIWIYNLLLHYLKVNSEKKYVRQAFERYMAPELVKALMRNREKLQYGGEQKEISVLFSDIRSFTTYSEKHEATETVAILKEYLTIMVDVIIRNKGILDKFVGDEIMALYNTPITLDNHALSACKTALEMREELTKLQNKWALEGREPFEIGIGVNTGLAVVGNLGSEQIFDYTAIGDNINLGARLEAINKEYHTEKHIIISEFTLAKVANQVEVRYLDEVRVKGKEKAVKIYELIRLLP